MKQKTKERKEFIIKKICKEKNWNPNNLSPDQMLIIIQNPEYKKIND